MNYGELVQQIQDECEYTETSFIDNIPNFVLRAEERIYYFVQLPFFKRNVTGVGSASNQYLLMPTDFLIPLSLAVIMASGEQSFLLFKDVNFMKEAFPLNSTEGTPQYYGLFEELNFILGPIPDDSFTYELHYSYQPDSISSGDDSTTTWLGDNAPNAMLYGSVMAAYMYMKGDEDLLAKAEEFFSVAIKRLQNLGEARSRKDIYRNGELRMPES